MALIALGSYGLTAPFIKDLEAEYESTLDIEDLDKYGRRAISLGLIILLASLFGLLVCYFGQYCGMVLFSIYLTLSTAAMVGIIIFIAINFSQIKKNTKNEARRMWRLASESDVDWTEEFETKV